MKTRLAPLFAVVFAALLASPLVTSAQTIDAAMQAKIDAKIAVLIATAADPVIVNAVRERNTAITPEHAAITEEKWKALTVLDPLVRSFAKNPIAVFLKGKKETDDFFTMFQLSDAKGRKIAFTMAKSQFWITAGNPKFDVPMTGKTWQGPVELNTATGVQQLQVSVPVLDDGKPIGVLICGISYAKLKSQSDKP